jgi:hypothetical protein
MALAKHTLRYLKGTATKGIQFQPQCRAKANKLECYVDASYADSADFRSQTGFVIKLNGAPISWVSKTQRCVATSTMEAELIACVDAVKEVIFLRELLNSWHCPHWHCQVTEPVPVYEDNESAISWFSSGLVSTKTKHYGTRLYFVRQHATDNATVILRKIHTDLQIADALTKSLARKKQAFHMDKIMRSILLSHVSSLVVDTNMYPHFAL